MVDRVRKRVDSHYRRLSERYGERTAKVIIAAALAGSLSPVPGSTLLAALPIVGLAELVKRAREQGVRSGWIRDRAEETARAISSPSESARA
jgi:hypothetical protein